MTKTREADDLGLRKEISLEEYLQLVKPTSGKKKNKYNAVKVQDDGFTFDSKHEHARYCQLKVCLQGGDIEKLELHPRWELVVNGKKIGRYTADFRYVREGKTIVEDAKAKSKAARSRDYILRKKLVEALYGIVIEEV